MIPPRRVGRVINENLGYAGAALAYLVAGIHLLHPRRGSPRLAVLLGTGDPSLLAYDPRPAVFVLSAFAILLGVLLVIRDTARKPVYAVGMLLVATYFAGYFAWHLSGHGGFLPRRRPHYHGLHPTEAVVSHLSTYPLAALSKVAEVALFAVLAVLYRRER